MSDEGRPSAPMSPLPPSSAEPAPYGRRRDDTLTGYRPADDDESERAYRWRARKGLQVARRTEASQIKLTAAVEGLTGGISSLSKLLKAAGVIAFGVVVASGTAWGLGLFGRLRLDPPAQVAPPAPPR